MCVEFGSSAVSFCLSTILYVACGKYIGRDRVSIIKLMSFQLSEQTSLTYLFV